MDYLVSTNIASLGKALAACIALIRSFTSVAPFMGLDSVSNKVCSGEELTVTTLRLPR